MHGSESEGETHLFSRATSYAEFLFVANPPIQLNLSGDKKKEFKQQVVGGEHLKMASLLTTFNEAPLPLASPPPLGLSVSSLTLSLFLPWYPVIFLSLPLSLCLSLNVKLVSAFEPR